jgi:hypothetical protein
VNYLEGVLTLNFAAAISILKLHGNFISDVKTNCQNTLTISIYLNNISTNKIEELEEKYNIEGFPFQLDSDSSKVCHFNFSREIKEFPQICSLRYNRRIKRFSVLTG